MIALIPHYDEGRLEVRSGSESETYGFFVALPSFEIQQVVRQVKGRTWETIEMERVPFTILLEATDAIAACKAKVKF